MKLNEITGIPKAEDIGDLLRSINKGVFAKDGRHLTTNSDLDFSFKNLKSLEGSPQVCEFSFLVQGNLLTTLSGGPQKVNGNLLCHDNVLFSTEGFPQEINGYISCFENSLVSLKDVHKHIKKMNGIFYAAANPIKSHVLGLLKIPGCFSVTLQNHTVNKIINRYLPLGDLIDCQEELIEAGFEEYAQL